MAAQILPCNLAPARASKPVNRKMPQRPRNVDVRTREYLTSDEIDALMAAARGIGRHGHRDATLILLGFRHGYASPSLWRCAGRSSTSMDGTLRR
jgi:type 1 fimbriae regulatory protein FimB/type 1 fimbriae regulatory protein FimE